MSVVIDFIAAKQEREPHIEGRARCLACKHEWHQVAPAGEVWFVCPSCSLERGRMIYPCQREGKEWTCLCGDDLFRITPEGCLCPNCGNWQTGF